MTIEIDPRAAIVFLCSVTGIVVLAYGLTLVSKYLFGHNYIRGLVPLLDLGEEGNIPTYLASALALLGSLMAFLIATAERRRSGRDHRYWGGLGMILVYLSADEIARVHEWVNAMIRVRASEPRPVYVSWVIPYGIAVLVVGLVYLGFVRRLPASTRRFMVLGGVIYVVGAIGLELAGGAYCVAHGNRVDLVRDLLNMSEETFEMGGMLLILYALMSYARSHLGDLSIRIAPTRSP